MNENKTSPCIRICQLDANQVCIGCGRTIDEIKKWLSMTEEERQDVIRRIKNENVN